MQAVARLTDHWQRILESLPHIVLAARPDGAFDYVSPQIRAYAGVPATALDGDGWIEIVHPDDRSTTIRTWRDCIRDGSDYSIEHRLRRADGDYRWFSCRVRPLRDPSGAIEMWTGVWTDITELKTSQERARQVAERIEQALAGSEIVIVDIGLTPDAGMTEVESYNMRGNDSHLPSTFEALLRRMIVPTDQDRFVAEMTRVVRGEVPELYVEFRPTGHQEERWRLGRGRVVRDEHGVPVRFLGTGQDVTRLKRAEEAARQATEQLRLALQLSRIEMWNYAVVDGKIDRSLGTHSNVAELFGHSRSELGVGFTDSVATTLMPEDQARAIQAAEDCIAGRTPLFEEEYRIRHRDGSFHWSLGRGIVVRDAAGTPLQFMGVSIDITRLKRAEEETRRIKERLELAMQLADVWVMDLDLNGIGNEPMRARLDSFNVLDQSRVSERPAVTALQEMNELMVPEDRPAAEGAFRAVVQGTAPELNIEHRVRNRDGGIGWRQGRGQVYRDAEGRPVRYLGVSHDITKVKRVEEELRRVKDRLELAVLGSKACTWDFELDEGRIAGSRPVFTNAWELCGHQAPSDPKLVGEAFSVVIPPEDVGPFIGKVQAFLDGSGREWESELKVVHQDGSYRYHLTRGVAARDAMGRATRFTGASIDITDRKQAEWALQASEERFRRTFENAAVGMILTDLHGTFLEYNARFCEFLGYSREELAGRSFTDFTNPEEVAADLEEQQRVVRGELASFSRDKRYYRKDGTVVWGNITVSIIQRDASGQPAQVMGIVQDITERKALETALQRTHAQVQLALRGSNVAVWAGDFPEGEVASSRWTFFNMWEMLRIDPATVPTDFEGVNALTVHPDDRPAILAQFAAMVQSRSTDFEAQHRVLRGDGSVMWSLSRGTLVYDEAGRVASFLGTQVDVTRLKMLESEIQNARERMELAMRGSNVAVWAGEFADDDVNSSRWTYYNMWEMLGIDPATAPDNFADANARTVHPDDRPAILAQFEAQVRKRSPDWYSEHRVLRADGSVLWTLTRGTIVFDEAGRVTSFLGTYVDITRLKLVEEELSRARAAAEAANRAKDEFLANVSHEIRTPMNAILGMTELALDSTPNEHQRQLLSTVRSAAKNLLGIINDLLDFSKITAGKLALDRADFSLRAAVGDTLRALAVRAHRKGLELLCSVQPDVPDVLHGDSGRLRQVLLNLVGNAIKFTARGEVEVDVEVASAPEADEVLLRFTVRDTGIGIARDQQSVIFRAFEQGDSSTTRKYGGTGLGLTISAQLAALMGGDIAVESELGLGSTFRFTARFARSSRPGLATASPERLAELRVLVVDDNETNRRILEEWLTSWRMRPQTVGDAAAALAALERAHSSGVPFPLVLLDGRMPDGDGVALAGQVRARYGSAGPRLILLSSGDDPGLSARSRENGVLAFLLKPVQQSELLEAIWAVMNLDLSLPTSEHTAGTGPARPAALRVLVAEDNELNVALLEELLGQRGHHAQFAPDGRGALELAKSGACDLLLLDLHMPEMDGFEVVHAIRQHERGTGRHLPIIALTARSSARDRERCLAAGMDEFLSKPIEAAVLWATVDRLVARFPPAGAAQRPSDPGLLDPRAILRACGGQAALLERLRVVFRQTLPLQMAHIRSALADRDLTAIREAAHRLVGTVGAFSTMTADVAAALEDAAIREERDSCAALVERLLSMCEALLEATLTLSIESLSL